MSLHENGPQCLKGHASSHQTPRGVNGATFPLFPRDDPGIDHWDLSKEQHLKPCPTLQGELEGMPLRLILVYFYKNIHYHICM